MQVQRRRFHQTALATVAALTLPAAASNAAAATAEDLDKDAAQALATLYKTCLLYTSRCV